MNDTLSALPAAVRTYRLPGDPWPDAHAVNAALLRETLRLGVAIERQRVAELTPEEIASAVARIDTHELHADEAMFAGRRAAEGMANIIRALALLSTVPGGITFMGMHWCSDHAACEQAAQEAGAA